MTSHAVDWLPPEAFHHKAVKAVFEPAVQGWSQSWFSAGGAFVSSVEFAAPASPNPGVQRLSGKAVTLDVSGRGKRHLIEAVLDVALSELQLVDGDRRLLDALATEVLNDLIERLDRDLREPGPGAGDEAELTVSLAAGEVCSILCPRHLVVPHLKKQARGPSEARGSLGGRGKAIKSSRVRVNGVLGRVELSMSDLEDLSQGDVLVLDRSLTDPVELHMADGGRLIAGGRLHRENNQLFIQL